MGKLNALDDITKVNQRKDSKITLKFKNKRCNSKTTDESNQKHFDERNKLKADESGLRKHDKIHVNNKFDLFLSF
jgi:hypothetical protein